MTNQTPEWVKAVVQVLFSLFWPAVWLALLWWSVRRDPRRLRNGFLLIFAVEAILQTVGGIFGLFDVGRLVNGGITLAWVLLLLGGAVTLPFALIANGVTMIRRESRRLGNTLTLVAGAAILLSPLLVVLVLGHPTWWTMALATLIGSLVIPVGYLFFGFLAYTVLYARIARRAPGNAVIVHGAQVVGTRVPPLLAGRLAAGIEAAQRADPEHPIPLVVSGGRGGDESVAEGTAMASWLRERGVAEDRIIVEDRSRTTEENLRFSSELLAARGIEPPYLVATSNYHAPRAALLARRLGIDAQVVGSRTAWYYLPSAYLREFVAVLRLRIRWVALACAPALLLTILAAAIGLQRGLW